MDNVSLFFARKAAVKHGVNWQEHWNFLDEFTDFTTSEGLQKLETYFQEKQKEANFELKSSSQLTLLGNAEAGPSKIASLLDDSLGDLNEQFERLKLWSPESPLSSTPRGTRAQKGSFLNENLTVSDFCAEAPHKFGNSTETRTVPCATQRQLNLSNGDGFESDESCDTYYTAAHSPPAHAEMLTPPSSPVFPPVFVWG